MDFESWLSQSTYRRRSGDCWRKRQRRCHGDTASDFAEIIFAILGVAAKIPTGAFELFCFLARNPLILFLRQADDPSVRFGHALRTDRSARRVRKKRQRTAPKTARLVGSGAGTASPVTEVEPRPTLLMSTKDRGEGV
jgi:hypothetical protein